MARKRRRTQLTNNQFVRALQLIRLKGLVTGRYEPMSDRETFYLKLLQAGRPADITDFVVSEPLLALERAQRQPRDVEDDEDEDEPAPSFTPPSEPAISPS